MIKRKQEMIIQFRDLSFPLKTAIVIAYIVGIFYATVFGISFFLALFGY